MEVQKGIRKRNWRQHVQTTLSRYFDVKRRREKEQSLENKVGSKACFIKMRERAISILIRVLQSREGNCDAREKM